MEKKDVSRTILHLLFFFAVGIWLIAVLVRAARTEGDQILYSEGRFWDCSQGWYDDEGNVYNIEEYVFTRDDVGKEKVFHYRIPEGVDLVGDESLCFFSRGMNFRLFSTTPEGTEYDLGAYDQNAANLSGTDIGLSYHVISLRQTNESDEISMAITPTEYSAFVLEMRVEDAAEFITATVLSRMPMFIGSIFIVFFGFAIIIYALFDVAAKRERKNTLYAWGAVSMTTGLILLIETQMIQILTGRPEFWTTIKYALCLIMGYFVALQIDYMAQAPHKHFSHVIGYITVGLLLVETAGTMLNILSFYRLWYLSALIQTFDSIMAIVLLFREIRYNKANKGNRFTVYLLASIPILGGVVWVDLLIYAMAGRHMTDWGRISRISYIIFIAIVLIFLLRKSIITYQRALEMEKYKIKSITDALTGLLNKGAYIEKEAELTGKLIKGREKGEESLSFALMSLDLNYLKKVNDNLGHEDGDRFIQAAANILKEAVGDRGETYRVGGDEFLAVIYGDDPEAAYRDVVQDLNRRVDEFNESENSDIPLCFAYGHAICRSDQEYSIHDSERIADQEMYECKHKMKAERK